MSHMCSSDTLVGQAFCKDVKNSGKLSGRSTTKINARNDSEMMELKNEFKVNVLFLKWIHWKEMQCSS